jgi:hypothetical protein
MKCINVVPYGDVNPYYKKRIGISSPQSGQTGSNNLIPGMALRMQNLLICALGAVVAFEILSL